MGSQVAPIRLLSPRLLGQIAAGEVVERPASVVKELLENSLDAGATQIEIAITSGGLEKIHIRDNGHGIPKEELSLALKAHATSKIREESDLGEIASLGFRGEALASIASVSHLTLISATQAEKQAWQIQVQGQEQAPKLLPAAHPVGCSVLVQDLFFNAPVRKKFQKSERTEALAILQLFKAIALSHFEVAFIFKQNEKLLYHLPKAENEKQKQSRLGKLLGSAFIKHVHSIHAKQGDIVLQGWITHHEFSRSQNDQQFFYVNGRFVKDKLLQNAIRQATAPFIPPGRYPGFVLNLSLPHRAVDVNVHPAKAELRFAHGREIHQFIVSYLQKGLIQQTEKPVLVTASEALPQAFNAPPLKRVSKPALTSKISADALTRQINFYRKLDNIQTLPQKLRGASSTISVEPTLSVSVEVLAEIEQKYAIAKQGEAVFIYDLKALEIQLVASALVTALSEKTPKTQPLLVPLIVKPTPVLGAMLQTDLSALARLGILLQPFSADTWRLSEVLPIFKQVHEWEYWLEKFFRTLKRLDQDEIHPNNLALFCYKWLGGDAPMMLGAKPADNIRAWQRLSVAQKVMPNDPPFQKITATLLHKLSAYTEEEA